MLPTRNISAAAIGGAVVVVLSWLLKQFAGVDPPTEVISALTLIVTVVIASWVSPFVPITEPDAPPPPREILPSPRDIPPLPRDIPPRQDAADPPLSSAARQAAIDRLAELQLRAERSGYNVPPEVSNEIRAILARLNNT